MWKHFNVRSFPPVTSTACHSFLCPYFIPSLHTQPVWNGLSFVRLSLKSLSSTHTDTQPQSSIIKKSSAYSTVPGRQAGRMTSAPQLCAPKSFESGIFFSFPSTHAEIHCSSSNPLTNTHARAFAQSLWGCRVNQWVEFQWAMVTG